MCLTCIEINLGRRCSKFTNSFSCCTYYMYRPNMHIHLTISQLYLSSLFTSSGTVFQSFVNLNIHNLRSWPYQICRLIELCPISRLHSGVCEPDVSSPPFEPSSLSRIYSVILNNRLRVLSHFLLTTDICLHLSLIKPT